MALTIGAIRPCPVLDWRFVLVGNNMIRGSAGMSLLTAEWLTAK
jgi:aspartate-semialdehyde dehydrogenase